MKSLTQILGLAVALLFAWPAWAQDAGLITIAPPPLPLYAQPTVPGDGYIWTPGYWAWNAVNDDYHWVPGTWVLAPEFGQLWTPGYWVFNGNGYLWSAGYWDTQVGYYGGLNYGYGYSGIGYRGGRWEGEHFRYNAAVSHVNPTITQGTYSRPIPAAAPTTHSSFRSLRSGQATPNSTAPVSLQSATVLRNLPTLAQQEHEHAALANTTQRAWVPHGPPQIAATVKPSAFAAPGVEHFRPAPVGHMSRAPAQHASPNAHAAPKNEWKEPPR